jgi:hypothetical protein
MVCSGSETYIFALQTQTHLFTFKIDTIMKANATERILNFDNFNELDQIEMKSIYGGADTVLIIRKDEDGHLIVSIALK